MKWAIKYSIRKPNVYIISLAKSNDQLEIYHCIQLKQAFYKQFPPYIIGIADNYEEAIKLVEVILSDCYENTGSYYVKDFLHVG